jgi:hypothetical protein
MIRQCISKQGSAPQMPDTEQVLDINHHAYFTVFVQYLGGLIRQ